MSKNTYRFNSFHFNAAVLFGFLLVVLLTDKEHCNDELIFIEFLEKKNNVFDPHCEFCSNLEKSKESKALLLYCSSLMPRRLFLFQVSVGRLRHGVHD